MLDSLTQEQKYTIAKFYKLYMERSNEGQSESEANYFGDSIKHKMIISVIVNTMIFREL